MLALKTETEVCVLGFGDHSAHCFIHVLVAKFYHVLYYALENIANKGINFCILPKTCFLFLKIIVNNSSVHSRKIEFYIHV